MYGFYVTNKGEELLAKTLQGEKITVTKACFGSGGNHNEPFNYNIEELVDQFYEKDLDPNTDLVIVNPLTPNQIEIITEIPVNVSGTINEIGYKDSSGNLILYGLVEEDIKTTDKKQIYQYENYIKFTQHEAENIEFSVSSTAYDELRLLINNLQNQINYLVGGDIDSRISELEDTVGTMTSTISTLEESNTDLISRVQSLEDSVGNAVERLNGAL